MTPMSAADRARQDRLEEVLGEYMQRLDRGEAVDREEFLAGHPDLAEELQSYFIDSDKVEQIAREAKVQPATESLHGTQRLLDARPEIAEEGLRVGDYELIEQIGEGGMGVIYKARQLSLHRLVALKMIRGDARLRPADVLRFRSEAEAVASLDHPNIVPIYEVGEHNGLPFFSMKLIEGGSLSSELRNQEAGVSQREAARILVAVARAVHHAHQRGILHRDLKPANVLLDAQGQPHVTDFGLAKRLMPGPEMANITQPGMIVGTPKYMAPEQAASTAAVTTAADVYALGAMLYELLAGRPPFGGETALETLRQVLEQEPVSPSRYNRRVDRDLETICLKCLQKEPQKRYASAQALADDLERWLRGEPVRARPVSRRERALKWVRRRPHLAALIALLVFTLVAGFTGVCWQWQRAEGLYRQATRSATAERQTAYARAISLAYAEWRAGNTGAAQLVLSACHPELCQWEWHYLGRLFQARQLATLKGHTNGVLAVAFSPDGKRIASAGADGLVKVWDRQSLREVLTLSGHTAVRAVAFTPDGKSLCSGDEDGIVRLWDAITGTALCTLRGHAAGVTGLAFDPTGRRLASTAGKPLYGELKLWDTRTGEILANRRWPNILAAVAFSADGKFLATAGRDGSVTAHDVLTLKPVRIFKGQTERTVPWSSVALSADGKWVAASSPEGLVRVWDSATTQEFFTALTPGQASVSGLAFAGPHGRILVAATADNTVQGWFTRSGKPAFTLRGHRRPVHGIASSPDGRFLASASADRTIKLWDLNQRDDDLTFRWPNQGVTSVAFSPDGTRLACATRDRALKGWDLATGEVVLTRRRLPAAVKVLSFSPDGSTLATASEDGSIQLRDAAAGREIAVLRGHAGGVLAISFHPDGERLASAGADGTVRIWKVSSLREGQRLSGHRGPVHAVAFSPDGTRLASGGEDGSRVWDVATGEGLLELDSGRPIYALAFSRDGRHLATAGQDEAIQVHDAITGELARSLQGHAGAVRALAYGPGGRLASAGDDKAVRLWDEAGQELLALRGHTEPLLAVVFSRDGHRLASAGNDGTVKVWDGTPLPLQRR